MAGEGDAERLVVLLEARTNDALKAMDRAEKKFDSSFGGMRRGSKTATKAMEEDMVRSTSRINQAIAATSTKIGGMGKAMVGGFVGGLVAGGVAGIVSQIGQVASAVAEVGDEAKRAGVGVETFQELRYVAEQNRIGVDSLTDGLKELNLRADEFIVTGGGSAADAFKRLGYSAEELNDKLKDPSALFTEIIGKLGQLDKAAQIRVADEIFGGTGGEKFVQLIAQGEDGLRRTIQQARDLGQVLDQQTIAKANDLDQAFKDVSSTVGTSLHQAIVNATWALFDFLQQFKAVEDRTTASLDQRLYDLGRKIVDLDREAMQADSDSRSDPMKTSLYRGFAVQAREEIAALREEEARILQILADREKPLNSPTASPVPTVPGSGANTGSKRDKEAEAIKRQHEAVQTLIASLEFEREIMGLSTSEQERLTMLRSVNIDAMSEEGIKLSELFQQVNDGMLASQIIAENATPFDVLRERMDELDGLLERGALSWDQYGQAAAAAQATAVSATLGAASQITGMLAQAFEENKMFATANAVVKGGEAVVSAFAAGNKIGGPPVGFAFASVAGLASAAQIAAINSTSKSSTSLGGGMGGGGAAGVAAPAPAKSQDVNIVLQGQAFGREQIRELLEQIGEAHGDGITLNVRAA